MVLRQILKEIADTGDSETYHDVWLADFKEMPVSIDQFICDPYYLGETTKNGAGVFPFWRQTLTDIFNHGNQYNEIILGGATRIGKTSTSVKIMAYMLYRLMLYRDPQGYFGLQPHSKLTLAFANLTKDLASGVAFSEFNQTLKHSKWFMEHGTMNRGTVNQIYVPDGDIEIIAGSSASNFLGMQIWCCMMDETNFAKSGIKDISIAKQHMKELYDTVSMRISGTFKLGGEVYGKLIAASSKNTDSDFLSDHIEKQLNAGNTSLYLVDQPQWVVQPKDRFSKEVFHFTVGDRYKRGFVIPPENDDEAHRQEYIQQGYNVVEAPAEFRTRFLADYDIALRDIAGISVVGAMGFITQEAITPNLSQTRHNPFFTDIIQVGTQDSLSIEQFFHLESVPPILKSRIMNIHLDLSEVSDRTGITGVCVDGTKLVTDFDGKKIEMPFLREVFSVGIEAPRGDRLSYQKVVNFLLWLRKQGFNIGTISTDQFQSSYMREILSAQGFHTDKISVDRSEEPYIGLKNILYDQRIELVHNDFRDNELIHLQRLNNKIDHPASGCFTADTKIQLVDGRSLSIAELLIEQTYRTNWVYTFNESTQKIEPKRIRKVFKTKYVTDLVKVTLDNGEEILCTPEHRFMLRDGSYEEIQNLSAGTSLMPLYTKISDNGLVGYRMYYEPMDDVWHYEHRSFCKKNSHISGYVVHHCNYVKLDNCPSNLRYMPKSDHIRIHNNETHDYSKTSAGVTSWHESVCNSDIYVKRSQKISYSVIRHNMKTGVHQEAERKRAEQKFRISEIERIFHVKWDELSYREKLSISEKYSNMLDPIKTKERYTNAIKKCTEESELIRKQHMADAMHRLRWYTNGIDNIYINIDANVREGYYPGRTMSKQWRDALDSAVSKRVYTDEHRKRLSDSASNRIWVTDGIVDKYINKDDPIPDGFVRGRCKIGKNHKIVNIEYIHQPCAVYDLEIEDNHNFALSAGVFVHNSKDISDSLCGACWTLTTEHVVSAVAPKSAISAMVSVNKPRNGKYNPMSSVFPGMNFNLRK